MTTTTRRGFAAMLGAAVLAPQVLRADVFKAKGPTCAYHGRALRGIDVVAYFDDGKAVEGLDQFSTAWRGALWRFASEEHQASFEMNPRAYAPKYGGYCALGMSQDAVLMSDPVAWQIHDGRLFMFNSLEARSVWERDIPGNIGRADGNWPAIAHKLAS